MNDYYSLSHIVRQVAEGKKEGFEQLYHLFRMLSVSLRRQFGFQDFEDRMHDVYLIVVEAIRTGKLREPAALPSYIHGVSRFVVCSQVNIRSRRARIGHSFRYWEMSNRPGAQTPEESLWVKQRVELMRQLLQTLSGKEREILTRFYLHEQPKEIICRDMQLTETQFRLTKSRAKARLSRLGSGLLTSRASAA